MHYGKQLTLNEVWTIWLYNTSTETFQTSHLHQLQKLSDSFKQQMIFQNQHTVIWNSCLS